MESFLLYMDLFLIFLIVRFTSERQPLMRDSILGRDVPSIVFINNEKLLKETCIKQLQ